MAVPSNMDAWRLSRIAEEADAVSFSSTDDGSSTPGGARSRQSTLERNLYACSNTAATVATGILSSKNYPSAGTVSTNHYSNVTTAVGPTSFSFTGCSNSEGTGDVRDATGAALSDSQSRDALRFIKEKYDSLGKVKVKKPDVTGGKILALTVQTSKAGSLSASLEASLCDSHTVAEMEAGVVVPDIANNADICTASRTISGLSLASVPFQNKRFAGVNPGHKLSSRSSGGYDMEQSYVSPFSDGCLFPLTPTTSPYSSVVNSVSDGVLSEAISAHSRTLSHPGGGSCVTGRDLQQVEMFYNSHMTTVSVCPCMAGLYLGNVKSLATPPPPFSAFGVTPNETNLGSSQKTSAWTFVKTGIPVLVLDSGESRRKRRLHIVLAERGTGFTLWRDSMDHLSEYTVQLPTFHTMYMSNDHARVVGLSFDNAEGAAELLKNLRGMTSDSSEKSVLNLSDGRLWKKKKSAEKTLKPKTKGRLSKAAISQPCCFTHVTQLDGQDMTAVLRKSGIWPGNTKETDLQKCERTDVNSRTVTKVAGVKHKT